MGSYSFFVCFLKVINDINLIFFKQGIRITFLSHYSLFLYNLMFPKTILGNKYHLFNEC